MHNTFDADQLDKVLSAVTDMIHMQNARNVAIKAGMFEIASAIREGLSEIAEAHQNKDG